MAGVEPASDEGEVISVLAVGMSSITTTAIVTLGMFALTPFVKYLQSDFLQPGFNNIMPALMGAMVVPHLMRNVKLAVVPVVIALLAGIMLSSGQYSSYQGIIMIVTMIISVFTVIQMNKNK